MGLSWWILEGAWEVLGRILETFWDMGGIAKTYSFPFRFLMILGVLEGVVVPFWCLCWAMLGARWVQDGFKRDLNLNFSPNLAS